MFILISGSALPHTTVTCSMVTVLVKELRIGQGRYNFAACLCVETSQLLWYEISPQTRGFKSKARSGRQAGLNSENDREAQLITANITST